MMKILLDTNVILDMLTDRDDSKYSRDLLIYILRNNVKAYILNEQITDIYYCLSKYLSSEEERRKRIEIILDTFELLSVLDATYRYCLRSKMIDFEDSIIDETAKINKIEFVVTNNIKHFSNGKVTPITPKDLLAIVNQ